MAKKNNAPSTKVITGPRTRWSYVNVWEPKSIQGSEPKYSVSLIIPKDDTVTIEKIKAAIKLAYEEGLQKLKGNAKSAPPLKSLKTTFYDGDLERPDDDAYANAYYINAKSKSAPGIVDSHTQPILDRDEVYSGCYGRASITFYAYNSGMSKGISNNMGYSGDLEIALIPESFRVDILKESPDSNKVLIENKDINVGKFALLFRFDGDIRAINHVMYNCSVSRPKIGSKTNEESKEVQTETLTISAKPLVKGFVKAKTGDSTPQTVYDNWFKSVYLPTTAAAASTSATAAN